MSRDAEIHTGSGKWDELLIRAVRCPACKAQGTWYYGESRRGSLGSESWEREGVYLSDTGYKRLVEALLKCSDPKEHRFHEECASREVLKPSDPVITYLEKAFDGQGRFEVKD